MTTHQRFGIQLLRQSISSSTIQNLRRSNQSISLVDAKTKYENEKWKKKKKKKSFSILAADAKRKKNIWRMRMKHSDSTLFCPYFLYHLKKIIQYCKNGTQLKCCLYCLE